MPRLSIFVNFKALSATVLTSSETQGQIKGVRESLNRRKNIYGTKKSKERREEPLGTMSYQTSSKRSPPFWLLIGARKTQVFWYQSEASRAATIWNLSGKTLSPGALLAVLYFSSFHIYFSTHLDFPSPPLCAPGSPRMQCRWIIIANWFQTNKSWKKKRGRVCYGHRYSEGYCSFFPRVHNKSYPVHPRHDDLANPRVLILQLHS